MIFFYSYDFIDKSMDIQMFMLYIRHDETKISNFILFPVNCVLFSKYCNKNEKNVL